MKSTPIAMESILQGVFLFDGPFLTISCDCNFYDIDLRFFANCRRSRGFFGDMPHIAIYWILFVWNGNLKMDQFYKCIAFWNFHLKKKVTNKWQCVTYHKKSPGFYNLQKIARHIIKITPTESCQKYSIK